MKRFRSTISIILSLLILLSAGVTASAADTSSSTTGSGDLVYFDASGWKNVTMIYCHIWKRGGDSFFGWQLKKESCKKVNGNTWSYDLANLDASTTMPGGLRSGEDYCIIFSAQTGKMTYDATFSKACVGDTLKLTGKLIENPVDSEKKSDEAVWTKNSDSYGPHLAVTSIGNIIGIFLCPKEKGTEVIGDWLITYYMSKNFSVVKALANAYPKFGITKAEDVKAIKNYILNKKSGEDEGGMTQMLDDAFYYAYQSHALNHFELKNKKATLYVNKEYNIQFKVNRTNRLSYTSSNKSVVTVKNGTITPMKKGKATIKISDGKTTKEMKITVKNPYLKKKTLTIKKGKSKKIKIVGKGKYTLFYSRNKKIAKVSANGKIKAIKKGKVKITVLTNGTSIDKTTSLETGKVQTTMKNGIKLVCTVKVK
ncbi:MAG: Ig-like domain-containing protein [Ruminococcus sp.]|nr:Ig-like domain-containing protein [Ruminococcus sp.]